MEEWAESVATLRRDFAEGGFAVAEAVLSGPETIELAAILDEALVRRRALEERPLAERAVLNRQFSHCYNVWEEEGRVRAVACDPRIAGIAAALLEAGAVRLFLDQTFYKEPGAESTSLHQDITRWPVRGRLVTAWIALDDVSLASGALAYVPGSHQVGPSSWLDLVTGRQWSDDQRALIEREPVMVPVRRGSILFHDACTFHAAGPNTTPHRRRAFAVVYVADGAERSSSLPFPSIDWDGVPVGDRIAGPRHPLAWPRPDGSLPPAPTSPPTHVPGWPLPVAPVA
jgi:ectoine hydroxylase-related dioxygenase (phytanoyl-CoA dioxygenase family)